MKPEQREAETRQGGSFLMMLLEHLDPAMPEGRHTPGIFSDTSQFPFLFP